MELSKALVLEQIFGSRKGFAMVQTAGPMVWANGTKKASRVNEPYGANGPHRANGADEVL